MHLVPRDGHERSTIVMIEADENEHPHLFLSASIPAPMQPQSIYVHNLSCLRPAIFMCIFSLLLFIFSPIPILSIFSLLFHLPHRASNIPTLLVDQEIAAVDAIVYVPEELGISVSILGVAFSLVYA